MLSVNCRFLSRSLFLCAAPQLSASLQNVHFHLPVVHPIKAAHHLPTSSAQHQPADMGQRKRADAAAPDNDTEERTVASSKRAKQSKVQPEAPAAATPPPPKKAVRKGKAPASDATEAAAVVPQAEGNAAAGQAYFLIKSEPHEFSVYDLEQKPNSTGEWDGVRSAQARNIMMSMKLGDLAFYYHSNTKEPGVVGIVKVVREHYPDFTATDKNHQGYDPKSSEDNPKWRMVDVQLVRRTERLIGLKELKQYKDGPLQGMQLFTMSRLSVQRVSREQWEFILGLEQADAGQAPDQ